MDTRLLPHMSLTGLLFYVAMAKAGKGVCLAAAATW